MRHRWPLRGGLGDDCDVTGVGERRLPLLDLQDVLAGVVVEIADRRHGVFGRGVQGVVVLDVDVDV